MTLLEHAEFYRRCGFSLTAIRADGSKRPTGYWKEFQESFPPDDWITGWFGHRGSRCPGIALIYGAISGNAELIDVDEPPLVKRLLSKVYRAVPKLEAAPLVRTPKTGIHLVYRSEGTIDGNQKLAMGLRPDRDSALKKKVLIETRGEGGYALAPGSPPACHPLNRPYVLERGDFTRIPVLTAAERSRVLEIARSFNELESTVLRLQGCSRSPGEQRGMVSHGAPLDGRTRPGDWLNANATWPETLEPHGWQLVRMRDGVGTWKRPDKLERGSSATTNHGGHDLLYVFSTNADPFEPERGYTKFSAYALLEHHGDFSAAARAIARRYGTRRPSDPPGNDYNRAIADQEYGNTPIAIPRESAATVQPWIARLRKKRRA